MFVDFDLNKDDDKSTDIDFRLLSEMFCRKEEEIKAEQEREEEKKRKAALQPKARSVLEVK